MSIFDRAAGVLATQPRPHMIRAAKAITTDSAPTILDPGCADRLVDFMENESVLLGLIDVIRMKRPIQPLNFIEMTPKLFRPGGCMTTCDTGGITGSRRVLQVNELKAAIPLCDDVLDENIEGDALEDHVIEMAGKALANELEIYGLMASLALNYRSPTVDDSIMILDDNFYEQLQTGHVLNGLSASDGRFISFCKIVQMMQTLPTQYQANPNLKLFMANNVLWDWNALLAGRQTALGDAQLAGTFGAGMADLPFVKLPLLPTDITSCSTGSAAGNATFMFLADPANLKMGIQTNNIEFERWRNGCEGRTYLIWKIRVDFLIENPDATVLYDCLDAGSCVPCPCP